MSTHDLTAEDLALIEWTLGREAKSCRNDAAALEAEYPETAENCKQAAERYEELAARVRKAIRG